MALAEQITWSVPADIPEVEILSAKNSQRAWFVLHETYTICNIDTFADEAGQTRQGGEAEWLYRGKLHFNPAETLMLLEPGEIHRNTKATPPCNFSVSLFDTKLVNRVAVESGLNPNPHFKKAVSNDPALWHAFVAFHTSLAEESALLHRQSLLIDCIGRLLAGSCEQKPHPTSHPARRRLRWAREFLDQHYAEKISLDQLADVAGLSRFHFLRAFSREFGQPPHRYQLLLRMERVRVLLKAGIPLHVIEAGFADQSHLIRHFKRTWGVSPGQYFRMIGLKPAAYRIGHRIDQEQ